MDRAKAQEQPEAVFRRAADPARYRFGDCFRAAGGSPFQDFATGILMGLSAGILLVGILAILLSFIRRK